MDISHLTRQSRETSGKQKLELESKDSKKSNAGATNKSCQPPKTPPQSIPGNTNHYQRLYPILDSCYFEESNSEVRHRNKDTPNKNENNSSPDKKNCATPPRNSSQSDVSSPSNTPPKSSTNVNNRTKVFQCGWQCLVGVVLLLVLGFTVSAFAVKMFKRSSENEKVEKLASTVDEKLFYHLRDIEKNHSAQSPRLWPNSMAAMKHAFNINSDQPGVLLLLGPNTEKSAETIQCIALKLARVVNKLHEKSTSNLLINLSSSNQASDIVKEELDSRMKAVLEDSYSVIVTDIHKIPASAALLFHGYCDNFMAPYKDRLIILTARFDGLPQHDEDGSETNKAADVFLRRLWDEQLGPDKAASLVSRVANNPVVLKPEKITNPCF